MGSRPSSSLPWACILHVVSTLFNRKGNNAIKSVHIKADQFTNFEVWSAGIMRAFYTNPQTFRYKSMKHIIDLEYEGVLNFSFQGQVSLAHVPVRPSSLLIRQKVSRTPFT